MNMIRTDQQIKKDIIDELYWDYRVDASNVQVGIAEGKVTLNGVVSTYSAQNAAVADAWGIAGVKDVTNLLSIVFPPTFDVPADQEIKRRAEMRLAWHSEFDQVDIDISVVRGVVKLEGAVNAYWQRWKAEHLVSELTGVRDIENHLTVVSGESYIDHDIAEQLESALERNPIIDADQVTVKVEHGQVTLTGSVPTHYARGRAYEIAAQTVGVLSVDNNVTVIN
jgi:osmotically-inducible protein OsmY